MFPRLGLSLLILSGFATAGEQGPWDRFFNKPGMTSQQGMDQVMSNAFASAFNPLDGKANAPGKAFKPLDSKANGVATQLLEAQAQLALSQAQLAFSTSRPCVVPLTEYKASAGKQFFIRSAKPENPALDKGMSKPSAVPTCR